MTTIVGKHAKQYVQITIKNSTQVRTCLLLYDNRSVALNDVYDDFACVYQPVNAWLSTFKETAAIIVPTKNPGLNPHTIDLRLGDAARREHLDLV